MSIPNLLGSLYGGKFNLAMILTGGWFIAPITHFLDEFILPSYVFMLHLMLLIFLDTLLGLYVAWKKKNISSYKFAQVFNKIIVYSVVLIASHSAVSIKIHSEMISEVFAWIDNAIYSSFVIRELLSLLEKASFLGVNMPARIKEKLDLFNKEGKKD